MKLGLIFAYLIAAFFYGIIVWLWVVIIRGIIQRRRDKKACQQRCRETIEKFKAKGKIKRPKGTYNPKRWGTKLVEYSHDLPGPRANSQQFAQFPDMPTIPTDNDES